MKCPLLPGYQIDEEGGREATLHECYRDQCEWWKETSQLCVINRLAGELYSLVEVMEDIRDKLEIIAKSTGIRG